MLRSSPSSTLTDTRFPYTTLFRSQYLATEVDLPPASCAHSINPQGGTMSRLLIITIVALAAMFPAMALATAQIPDRIRIDGKDYALNTNPLTPRPVASGWLPPKEARVSSANGRGYTAAWGIADGRHVRRDRQRDGKG